MTINFQGAVYHRAGQYIDFYVLIVTWQHTYWSPTLITSPNITLWYWVSTSWQVAVKTNKSVCPALHAFRRCIVSCLQPVNTVVDHLLWLSRELSKFWENNPDHVIGVSQVLAYNVVYIYTHTHTQGESAQQTLSVGHERCGYLLSGTKDLLCILGNVGLWPSHSTRNIFPPAARLLNSSSNEKNSFSWLALLTFPCTTLCCRIKNTWLWNLVILDSF